MLSVFPFSCEMQKLELQEPLNTHIPCIPGHPGAVNNPELRELDSLKIAPNSLCNISPGSGGSCWGQTDWRGEERKQLIGNSKLQKPKSGVKWQRKGSTGKKNSDKPLSRIPFHALCFSALEQPPSKGCKKSS